MIFAGEYDLSRRLELRAAFDSLATTQAVVLDFTLVTYIDSTIISELVRLHNARAAKEFERETIVVRHRNLLRVFDVLRLDGVLRIVDTLDEAIPKDGRSAIVRQASSYGVSSSNAAAFTQ